MSNVYKFGFTLLELVIAMAVFGILTTVAVVDFQKGSRNDAARQGARLAEAVLRRAQTMTLSGTITGGSFPAGGYGVRFDSAAPTQVTLFADASGNFNYNAGEELTNGTVTLPSKVTFSGATLNVVFSPPEGRVYFNGLSSPDTRSVIFQAGGAALTKQVVIYRLTGLVRVE